MLRGVWTRRTNSNRSNLASPSHRGIPAASSESPDATVSHDRVHNHDHGHAPGPPTVSDQTSTGNGSAVEPDAAVVPPGTVTATPV